MEPVEKAYIDVAVALPVWGAFTYEVPPALQAEAQVGKRVLVPFKHRKVTGYVLNFKHQTDQKGIKPILCVLDSVPLFPACMVAFFDWISNYYRYPIGGVIQGALPAGLKLTEMETLHITDSGRSALSSASLKPEDRAVLQILQERSSIRLPVLQRKINEKVSLKALQRLEAAGRIIRERKLKPGRACPRLEKMEKDVYLDPFGEAISLEPSGPILTADQDTVVQRLLNGLGRGFRTYLLDGVTGSGKTEVYMRAVAETLEHKRQAIVLVPEIGLISQMERRFRARFGRCVALLHSGLSDGERLDQWMRIVRKEASVAIGARSAIFAPFENLGLIVVDEEHDDSYKQESKLRYHARDLAVVRAKMHGALALLASATPSVSSYYKMRTGKFDGLSLSRRVDNRKLPEVMVVDLREQQGRRRTKPFITPELHDAMKETLSRGEQTLLFLNRRGFANYPACVRCGTPVRCKNCDVTMTLHQGENVLMCHYCGHVRGRTVACLACGGSELKILGLGTERVEHKIKEIFPEARVARMDRDTTKTAGSLIKILRDLRDGRIDILVGTQMIAKGHDYPNITLVGIICADLSLNFPDFRAGERTFQLLAQVSGRAGRGDRPGRVILQTFNPDHFCISTARDQDYQAFYRHEIGFRKALEYPPFSRLIQILVAGRDKELAAQCAKVLGETCRTLQSKTERLRKDVQRLGPVAAPLARLQKQYRWQLLLKGKNLSSLHTLTRDLMDTVQAKIPKTGVKITVDVDPVDML